MASYFSDETDSPPAVKIHAGVVVALYREKQILLDHRRDGNWGLIGGALELGESVEDCGVREVFEETGLQISELELVGIFSDPKRKILRNEQVVQLLTTCFAAEAPDSHIRISEESTDARFFGENEFTSLDVVATHKVIIPYLFARNLWPVML